MAIPIDTDFRIFDNNVIVGRSELKHFDLLKPKLNDSTQRRAQSTGCQVDVGVHNVSGITLFYDLFLMTENEKATKNLKPKVM